jgi:hypothetical protein
MYVYAPADTAEELLQRVQNGFTSIRNTPDMSQSTHRRAEACVTVQGQQFGHLL